MKKLVDLLRENARLSNEQLAVILGTTEEEVAKEIKQLEDSGIIIGYSAIINEEELNKNAALVAFTVLHT